jgi:apolipoprotein N-acyltransferase
VAARVASLTGWRRAAIAVVAGAATALAQPPVSQPAVLFVALPALFWLLDGAGGRRDAFGVGWFAGVGHFAAALFWIVEPFLVQPEVHGWMAPFALVGMAGGLALFWAAPFALARTWPPGLGRLLALAALWTLADYLRAHLLGGFPWGLVAYAWVDTPVIQAAALFGPHLLGLLTLVAALLPATGRPAAVAVAAALVAVGWGFGAWRLAQPLPAREPPFVVRLVQPDADQREKWLPGMEQLFYERHLALTRAPAAPRPDATIWSETAVPFLLGEDLALLAESAAAAAPGRLILGIRRVEAADGGERWFNSLAVLEADGGTAAVYDKHHLVPFGEYMPLAGLLGRLGVPALTTLTESGFSAGSGPTIVAAPGVPAFLPLICYEAIFPHGLRAPEGRPEWLVQVTNDAWFGTASGPYQHLAQARVRAIEQGLPLARAANTGISAMIDPYGRVIASLGLGETGYVDTALPPALSVTGYARFGDTPALIVSSVLLGLTLAAFFGGTFLKLDR